MNTNIIFDIGSKLLAFCQSYNFAWKHYCKVDIIRINGKAGYFKKQLTMSRELVTAIGFDKQRGETISLKDFIDNIPKIMENLNKEELLYEQLDYLHSIFQDKKKCIKLLEDFEKLAREKLRHIYIIRNKIVHNASSEQNTLSQYYLDFLNTASMIITQKFMKKRHLKNLETIDDVLNDILYDFDKLKIDLTNDGTQILFKRSN